MKLADAVAKAFTPQHVLVFGDPGTGKSVLTGQLAEAGYNLKWLSLDGGHKVLSRLSPAAQARVEIYNIPDTRNYPVGLDTIRELLDRKNLNICDQHGKQACSVCLKEGKSFSVLDLTKMNPHTDIIVIDPISQLTSSILALICKGKPVDYKLQLDDWGSLKFHMEKYFTDIQQFPFHMVCIAHAVEEEMVDKAKKIMPALGSSSFAPKSAGYFDHVVYCNISSASHQFGSASTYRPLIVTKSRSDIAIEKMKVASLVPFFDGSMPSKEEAKVAGTVASLTGSAAKAAVLTK